ncbi:MAG: phosphatase PAP2 family protein [Geminicoccaceae bacterium]
MGTVGTAGAAGYDPLTTSSLLTNRDGIAGAWTGPGQVPTAHPTDPAVRLRIMGATERASVMHTELMSRLSFQIGERNLDTANGETFGDRPEERFVNVQHLDFAAAPTLRPLVEITRPSETTFIQQLDIVDQYADLRSDRTAEILAQLNAPTAYFSSIVALDNSRFPKTLELLNATLRLAYSVVIQIKHGLACRRPHEYSPQIQPMIPVPQHGAFPSGHATEGFIAAYVFWMLLRAVRDQATSPTSPSGATQYADVTWGTQFMRLASRIAINRTVAGVHFPADSAAGALLGLTLGRYLAGRCNYAVMPGTSIQYDAWNFDGATFPGTQDFHWEDLFDVTTQTQSATAYATSAASPSLPATDQSPALQWLWDEAVDEWL